MTEPEIKGIERELENKKKELSAKSAKKKEIDLKLGLLTTTLLDNSEVCLSLLFFKALENLLERIVANQEKPQPAVKNMHKRLCTLFKERKKVYGDYFKPFNKKTPLSQALTQKVAAVLEELSKAEDGKETIDTQDIWIKVRKEPDEKDWKELNEEAARISSLFTKEKKKLLNDQTTLNRELHSLKEQISEHESKRGRLICEEKAGLLEKKVKEADPENWKANWNKLASKYDLRTLTGIKEATLAVTELEKSLNHTKNICEKCNNTLRLLKKISEQTYPDLCNSAKSTMEKLQKASQDLKYAEKDITKPDPETLQTAAQPILEAEKEALELKHECVARNKLKEKVPAEINALKQKKEDICNITKELGVACSLEKDFGVLENRPSSEFYTEEFQELLEEMKGRIDAFHVPMMYLQKAHTNHKEEIDFAKLTSTLNRVLEKWNADGMEKLVRLLRWVVNHKDLGQEKIGRLLELTNNKNYEKEVREFLEQYKTEAERQTDTRIDGLNRQIADMKQKLGFGSMSNYSILMRYGNLHRCINDDGIDKLSEVGRFEHVFVHDHHLLGLQPSLQSLGFKTAKVMAADKYKVEFGHTDKKRLVCIKKLVGMIAQLREIQLQEEKEKGAAS